MKSTGFRKLGGSARIPRFYLVEGEASSGKTDLALGAGLLNGVDRPILFIDLDNRLGEKKFSVGDRPIYVITQEDFTHRSSTGSWLDKLEDLDKYLADNMPGSGIECIVLDSATPIISDEIQRARLHPEGKGVTAYSEKADVMKTLQHVLFRWGVDVVIIHHVDQTISVDTRKATTKTSITDLEINRLTKRLNARILVTANPDKTRTAKIVWSRWRYPVSVIDRSGSWQNIFPLLEDAMYGGLGQADIVKLQNAEPKEFHDRAAAVQWALDTQPEIWNQTDGAPTINHAQNTYDALLKTMTDLSLTQSPSGIASAWIAEVNRRVKILTDSVGPDRTLWPAEIKRISAAKAKAKATAQKQTQTDQDQADQPSAWLKMQAMLTDQHREYIAEIIAAINAGNGSTVTPAQATTLVNAIGHAAATFDDDKIEAVINLLCGRREGPISTVPLAAYAFIGWDILTEVKGQPNGRYNADKVNLINEIAGIADTVLSETVIGQSTN